MKKHILCIIVFMTALFVLDSCTNLILRKETDDGVQVFATDEPQNNGESALPAESPHQYTVETYEGEVTHPDGTVLATYSYSYPVFECNDGDDEECIEKINDIFKESALTLASDTEAEREFLVGDYEYLMETHGQWWGPCDYRYDFEIHMDAEGILSVTEIWYAYTGGAHGNASKKSHTFDVVNGKELSLSDLLYGTDEEITGAYTAEFMKNKEAFYDDPAVVVPKEFPMAQFYVDTDGVTAYFQQYQVGAYAYGFVSATITDKEMLKYDFSDMIEE